MLVHGALPLTPQCACVKVGLRARASLLPRRGSSSNEDVAKRSELLLRCVRAECGRLLCALSLLGAGSVAAAAAAFAGETRSVSEICPSATSCSLNVEESQHDHESQHNDDGCNLDEDLRREYEQWKTVPYTLTVPLRIVSLRGSVPTIWVQDFIASQGKRMKLSAEFQGSLDAIYKQLSSEKQSGKLSKRSAMSADVVTLGDSWLGAAIGTGVIVPVGKAEELDWFQRLHPKWQAILQRDAKGYPNMTGDVWGAPYRCGCMVIAYRKDKFKKAGLEPIKDWKDLWKPELTGKVSMIDSSREVIGLVLKSMGASYNTKNFDEEVDGGQLAVKERLHSLRKQVRVFDNVNYLKALGVGDVWVAVGWSLDVLPFAIRTSNVGVVAPASGTSLWADVWAVPATTSIHSDRVGGRIRGPSPLVSQWLDFCLQPARSLALKQEGASPLSFSDIDEEGPPQTGPQYDTNMVMGLPPTEVLDRSEFLEPLGDEALAQYSWLLESESSKQK